MRELIERLVREKKEGLWWDFKQKYHATLADLLHDILCMANILYKGDRYIIFGVDNEYKIIGLDSNDRRYTQADILNYLRAKIFANHNIPSIEMKQVDINDLKVDILVIKNERLKPYYLTKDEKKGAAIIVRAGVVYSRLEDTNTPKDSCANPQEIESMWRERFGLDLKASDRFVQILIDFENWKYDGEHKAFYDKDPDYTIEIGELESSEGKFWWQKALFEKPSIYSYYLKCKNVEVHKISVIRFNSENLCIPFPEVEYVTYPEKDDGYITDCYCGVFYFRKNSIKYSLFYYIRSLEVNKPSAKSYLTPIESQIKLPIIKLPFLILDPEFSVGEVSKIIKENFSNFIKEKEKKLSNIDFNDKEKKRLEAERIFSEWVLEIVSNEKRKLDKSS